MAPPRANDRRGGELEVAGGAARLIEVGIFRTADAGDGDIDCVGIGVV